MARSSKASQSQKEGWFSMSEELNHLLNCECSKCHAKFKIPLKKLVCARCPVCNNFEITFEGSS
jgi:hypothetical protein